MTRDEYRDKYGPSGRPLPRFCVPKNAGTLEETVRCIDDGKLSGSNYATRMPETIVPPTSEVTRVIRIMREQIEAVRLLVHEGWRPARRRRLGASAEVLGRKLLGARDVGGVASQPSRVGRVR